MPRIRPQQTVLSGLGIAGAVLAAVVVTFALASGIIAYSLTAAEPLVSSSAALVLDPVSATGLTRAPLVLRRSRGASASRASTAAALPPGRGTGASGSLTPARGGGVDVQTPSATQGSSKGGDQPTQPVAAGGRRPVGTAIDDTAQAVGATTGSLGRGLQAATEELKTGTHALVHTAVTRTAAALGRLLGPQN